jgi:basic membrane lipoprotein Med (substrate-binding protein (PBP1-ABC) superfamily)
MRHLFAPLLIATLLVASGCDKPKSAASTSLKVALVTTGSVGDGGWNSTAYAGLQQVKATLGAQVSNVETKSPGEFEESFRDYASRGYTLVFGHGFEYQEAALKVAPEFPQTTFVITSGAQAKDNVVPIIFGFGEATYLAGMAAAAVSKSGKLGAIGGQPFPPVKDGFDAFLRGAKAVNPNASMVVSYVGNWEDAAAAKEAAKAQLHTGVDVIIQNADAAGMGVFQTVRETPGAYAVGTNSNQNDVVPDKILGSAVNDVAAAFVYVAEQTKAGKPPRGVLRLGMREGVVRFEENEALAGAFAAVQDKLEAAGNELRSAQPAIPVSATAP